MSTVSSPDMGSSPKTVFLSMVTEEFGDIRGFLGRLITDDDFIKAEFQEQFVYFTEDCTLDELARRVRRSHIVVHVIGGLTGGCPPVDHVRNLLPNLISSEGRTFAEVFPEVAELALEKKVSYTQWEIWLGLFYRKTIKVFRYDPAFDIGYEKEDVNQRENQSRHMQRLGKLKKYAQSAEIPHITGLTMLLQKYLLDKNMIGNVTLDGLRLEEIASRSLSEIVISANELAREWYKRHLLQELGEASELFPHREVWEEIFGPQEMKAQLEFVDTVSVKNEDVAEKTCREVEDATRQNKSRKILIVGEAGVGKSTTLYNVFFSMLTEEEKFPVPWLVQPQEFDHENVKEFQSAKDPFQNLLLTWLVKRNVIGEPNQNQLALLKQHDDIKRLTRELKQQLRDGGLVLLIDSYDELARMDFQISLFKTLFSECKYFVCASRPETAKLDVSYLEIKLLSPWALPTIEKYLAKRLTLDADNAKALQTYIRHHDKEDWLRNPRYLNLLVDVIEHFVTNASDPNDVSEDDILTFVEQGEFELFRRVMSDVNGRIERYLRLRGEKEFDSEKVQRMLTSVAVEQLHSGMHLIEESVLESGDGDYWKAISKAESIVRSVESDQGIEIALLNHNLVDYFLAPVIAKEIESGGGLQQFQQLWTNHLLGYVSHELIRRSRRLDGVRDAIWNQLLKAPEADRLRARNLVHLLIAVESGHLASEKQLARVSDARKLVQIQSRSELANQNLANTNLSEISFKNCKFENTVLNDSILYGATFSHCDFVGANLQYANAGSARFWNCRFDFTSSEPVANLEIKSTEFKNCKAKVVDQKTKQTIEVPVDTSLLIEHGALNTGSRYANKFGRDFLKNQKKYLGDGLSEAEDVYMDGFIKNHLDDLQANQSEVYLIDLMAGGNNDRITQLFHARPRLEVLAIDKYTQGLTEIKSDIGERIKVVEMEIDGDIQLGDLVQQQFNSQKENFLVRFMPGSLKRRKLVEQVDLIIGKKALHEIPREDQIKLLEKCFQVLRPGGYLILFTDSPVEMTEKGYQRLEDVRSFIRKSPEDIDAIRELVLNEIELGDSPDDQAIYSNLWVLLKDWANQNITELEMRYFSSIAEIKRWTAGCGFELEQEPYKNHYTLIAKFFNEYAFNQIEALLETKPRDESLTQREILTTKNLLKGGPKYQIFFDFAERSLYHKNGSPTPLGLAMKAEQIDLAVKFREFKEQLRGDAIPFSHGVGFQFTVHVAVFRKPN